MWVFLCVAVLNAVLARAHDDAAAVLGGRPVNRRLDEWISYDRVGKRPVEATAAADGEVEPLAVRLDVHVALPQLAGRLCVSEPAVGLLPPQETAAYRYAYCRAVPHRRRR